MFRVQIGHAFICLRTPYQTLSNEFFKLRNEFYFYFADLLEASYFVVNGQLFKRFQHVFRPFGAPKSIRNHSTEFESIMLPYNVLMKVD